MGGEDVQSRNPNPIPMVQGTCKIDNLFDANGLDDNGKENGKNVKGPWEDEDNADAPCWKKQKGDT